MYKPLHLKISGKKYLVKDDKQAYALFQKLAGFPITEIEFLKDIVLLFYCILQTVNKPFKMSLEEFTEELYLDGDLIPKFTVYMSSINDFRAVNETIIKQSTKYNLN